MDNTTQPKVSVIVPVYNAERYLKECLDSIINQTLKNIEIICVNDSSTDRSVEILKQYLKKDNRIKLIDNLNKGAGASRNKGIYVAKGEYLCFLDADDIFSLDMLKDEYLFAKKKDADIIFTKFISWNTSKDEKIISGYWRKDHIENFSGVKDAILVTTPAPWNKLYKTDFVKKNNIQFQNLRVCDDHAFHVKTFLLAESIFFIDNAYVTYRRNEFNLSSTRHKHALCIIEAAEEIRRFLTEKN